MTTARVWDGGTETVAVGERLVESKDMQRDEKGEGDED